MIDRNLFNSHMPEKKKELPFEMGFKGMARPVTRAAIFLQLIIINSCIMANMKCFSLTLPEQKRVGSDSPMSAGGGGLEAGGRRVRL